tara:strand:- start:2972 stop:3244 length:273 start_codon:yes stop_codon:yes gene_type:complete
LLSALALTLPITAESASDVELEDEARALTQQFIGQLKPRLQEAMSEGGPSHAIDICVEVAPRIADALSADTGYGLGQVRGAISLSKGLAP